MRFTPFPLPSAPGPNPTNVARRGAAAIAATIAVLLATPPAGAGRAPAPGARPAVSCAGAIQHPLEVRVRALDPVRRGQPVRLEVRVTAAAAVSDAEIRVASAGGTTLLSAARLPIESLEPAREAVGRFQVQVPEEGRRFLVQFTVRGEGANGPIARGAAYNLLPDGPLETARRVAASDGTDRLEVRAKRRAR